MVNLRYLNQLGWVQNLAAGMLVSYLRYKTRTQLRLENIQNPSLPNPKTGHKYVLYVHIPFCESLCPYCSFNRFIYNEERTRAYFKNLRDEMGMVASLGYNFISMYIGGGTPTILIDELTKTIDLAKELFNIQIISCETNPNHLQPEILNKLKGRVDRLSVGIQSFDDVLLHQMSRLGRFGSGQQILERIQNAVGILPSLNVDMIFNFPSQTETGLRADIQKVIASGADQVTFYPLMSAPSVLAAMGRALGQVDMSRERHFYSIITQGLDGSFTPMSAWTYSRQRQTVIDEYIAENEEYVGIGSGSFSYLNGCLYVNTFSLGDYEKAIQAHTLAVTARRQFGLLERMQYRFMMELFDLKLDKKRFQRDFGFPVEIGLWKENLFMELLGALSKSDRNFISLRSDSSYLMVLMMREFFSAVNIIRDQARESLKVEERLLCLIDGKVYY